MKTVTPSWPWSPSTPPANRGRAGDRDAVEEAAALYQGDVLPDCAGDWIDGDRERLRQRAQQVLTRLVGLLEREKRLPMRSIRLNTCSGSIHSTSKHGVRSCTRAA